MSWKTPTSRRPRNSPKWFEPRIMFSIARIASGGSTAHRKALRRAHTETSSRYASSGRYQRIDVTMTSRNDPCSLSQIVPSQAMSMSPSTGVAEAHRPDDGKQDLQHRAHSRTNSGTTTAAVSSLDSTTSVSDTGSDFQNRMLRSLRSASRRIE